MLHRLFIAAALVASGPLIGSAVSSATGISTGQAQAADFTGRIKRVKIKRRRVGSGFKIRTVNESGSADAVAGGLTTVRSAVTGEVITEVGLGDARRGRVHAVGDYTDFDDLVSDVSTFSIGFDAGLINADGSVEGSAPTNITLELSVTESGRVRGEGVGENGWKARLRTTPDGGVRVVLLHENTRWAGDGVSNLRLEGPEGSAELVIDSVAQAFVANTDVDLDAAGLLEVESRVEMTDGSVVTRTEIVDATPEPAAPRLDKITARQTRNDEAKLVTITEGEGLSLAVELTDNATGETVISTVDAAPISTVRIYEHTGLAFDAGDDPADYIYLMLIDMLDSNGDPIGEQYAVELALPALVEGEVTLSIAPFGDGLGQVVVARDAEGFAFSVGVRNTAEVDSVSLIFEEPFEGPQPLEIEINATSAGQLNKWVQKGQTALPANFTVNTVMTNAEGVVVGGGTSAGDGPGAVYKNGSGTKKAPAGLSRQPQIALL